MTEREAFVIDAKLMQDCGMQIVDINFVFDDRIAEVIRLAETDSWLETAAGHKD